MRSTLHRALRFRSERTSGSGTDKRLRFGFLTFPVAFNFRAVLLKTAANFGPGKVTRSCAASPPVRKTAPTGQRGFNLECNRRSRQRFRRVAG